VSDDSQSEIPRHKRKSKARAGRDHKSQADNPPADGHPGSNGENPATEKPKKGEEAEQKPKTSIEVYSLAANTIIAAAAVIGLFYGAIQIQVAMRATSEAREGMVATNRAWIIVIDAAKLDIATNTPNPKITIKNSGNSPAIIEKYWVNRVVRAGPLRKPSDAGDGPYRGYGNAVVAPGLTFDVSGELPPITAWVQAEVRQGSMYLYFVGTFEYSDPFGSGRETDFCFYWTPVDWVACPGGTTFK
jgi:hypothetical protein